MKTYKITILTACIGIMPSLASASCGSAFCTVNSNWTSESALTESGSVFDLRYEYINQNQLRAGSDKAVAGQIPRDHDEVRTVNRNLLATYSYTFDSGVGISVIAPIVDRNHAHVHNDDDGTQTPATWKFRELGDVRVVGRYQLPFIGNPTQPGTTGVIFGVKLPTGRTKVENAEGEFAERTLQPGSGTTDIILGAYFHQKLSQWDSAWFAQFQYQHALSSHDQFKPGSQLGVDVGFRYGVSDNLGALVQVNALAKQRDSGAQAEPNDSGGRYVSISPGLSYAVTENLQIYGFFQKPVYQHVNGVQLTVNKALVAGLSARF
jgi:hypothetical protein